VGGLHLNILFLKFFRKMIYLVFLSVYAFCIFRQKLMFLPFITFIFIAHDFKDFNELYGSKISNTPICLL